MRYKIGFKSISELKYSYFSKSLGFTHARLSETLETQIIGTIWLIKSL